MSRRRIVVTLTAILLATLPRMAFAFGECSRLDGGVDLLLRDIPKTARASGSVACVASNNVTNYEGTFSGTIKVHQVNPSTDFSSPFSGSGEWVGSVEGPAEYSVKTCYQGFLNASGGGASGSWQSTEACTPDPPPTPGDGAEQKSDDNGCTGSCNSPIVINLGGGAYSLSGAGDPVAFDIDANGTLDHIGWTAAGAPLAFLALDRNHNGTIDNGSELFGNHTALPNGTVAANGFDALVPYDLNHDGTIDQNDPVWSLLVLWTDQNHDGVSQVSEITPVSQSALIGIGLDYHWTGRRDVSGNTFRYQSSVWIGSSRRSTPRPAYDIFFVSGP